ncbi:MAG: hypothetical protein K9M57_00605 [Phycisphaerae bacterium]|nr:hypothetical protein [Phycisphaerae bacterium]
MASNPNMTHRGQPALPIYGAMFTFSKFDKKLEVEKYESADTMLYVNRGLGTRGRRTPRARFMARPEITILEIRKP